MASDADNQILAESFSDAPVMMQITELDGTITAVTQYWAEKLGYSPDEMVGQSDRSFQTKGSSENLDNIQAAAMTSGQVVNEPLNYVHKDGTTLAVQWSAVLEHNAEGEPVHFASVYVENHADTQSHILQTHQQRTEAVSSLLSGVAHDFNNILTVVQGNLEMTLEETDDALVRLFMNDAMAAIDRGAKLTNQLLSFSSPVSSNPKALDANSVLRNAESVLRRLTPERISLSITCASDLWLTVLDSSQFQKVLLALVSNASDAMPHNGDLHFETANTSLDSAFAQQISPDLVPGPYVMVTMSDTSDSLLAGLDGHSADGEDANQPLLPQPERNLDMVQDFINESGGTMLVSGQPGSGRKITLLFPAVPEAGQTSSAPELQPAADGAKSSAPAQSASNATLANVLVVEDEVEVRRVLVRQLSRNGVTVTEAGDGDEAYAMLEQGYRPKIMVTDVVMPGFLQGPDLVKRARELVPDLRVIYVSGYLTEAGLGDEIDSNDLQLMKPVGRETFVSAIQRALAEVEND